MTLALRACLFASAAAGLAACASNPPLQAAAIDYRRDDPSGVHMRRTTQPQVMADNTQTRAAPPPAASAPVAPSHGAPTPEIPPYQIVADLGPSSGLSASVEARSMSPESGGRPGGARTVVRDNPAARAVEVLPRDTLYDISRRYNVNMRALIETNDLAPPYRLDVGAVIYLPPQNIHTVENGETLYSVSRRYNVDTRSLALLNGMARPWTVWPGDLLLLPPLARDQSRTSSKSVALAPNPSLPAPIIQTATVPATTAKPTAAKPTASKPAETKVAVAPPPVAASGPISLKTAAALPAKPELKPDTKATKSTAAAPTPAPVAKSVLPQPQQTAPQVPVGSREFIWPVSGPVLKGFGLSADGQRNDGVNISAAKGAEVRAAAGGEVVYAGSELAGFGNLVLIRHPGGWVTAYAHADSVQVAEGDLVKQGQPIAKAGSTGNAASPQVHFELRKGKEPVDPTLHLPALRG